MDERTIRQNVDAAITGFKDAHQAYKIVRHHPGTSLEREIAEAACMGERLKSLQQMRMIVGNRDDMTWNEFTP